MSRNKKLTNQEWKRLETTLLWAYKNPVPAQSSNLEIKRAEHFSLWLIIKGQVSFMLPDKSIDKAEAGKLVATSPGVKRSQQFSSGAYILSIAFNARWPDGINLFQQKKSIIANINDYPELEHAAINLQEFICGNYDPVYTKQPAAKAGFAVNTGMNIRFWEFLRQWHQFMKQHKYVPVVPEKTDPRLDAAVTILHKHHFNAPLPYDRITRATGISRSHFDRLFSQQFNLSPRRYCERICLDKTFELLSSSHLTIKEIAYETGFVNVSHFCTWFKRKTSQTPEEYRRYLI